MAPFRNFKVEIEGRIMDYALGNSGFRGWCIVRSPASVDENIHPPGAVMLTISKISGEGPSTTLSAAGNPLVALIDHHKGWVSGMMRRTGRFIRQESPQGEVQLPVVEILVPEAELIRHCEGCHAWEEVAEPRFKKCAKCKIVYYCSGGCQKEDWKAFHKALCKKGLTVKEVNAMQKDKLDGLLTKAGLQAGKYYYPSGSHDAVF